MNTSLFMMLGYAQDGYLMVKTTPSADVVDDGGERHGSSHDISWHRQDGDG
jgi:hypothetical protein